MGGEVLSGKEKKMGGVIEAFREYAFLPFESKKKSYAFTYSM
jgi:hypothetical protein